MKKRATLIRALLLMTMAGAATTTACSSGGATPADGGRGSGGSSGSGTGGSTGSGGGGAPTAVMDCPTEATGTGTFPTVGVCGQRGRATATATTFDGYEELFVIGEEGLGSDVCVVRFDLKRVGNAPGGCADCVWSHAVEYSNPVVMLGGGDTGPCSQSQFALTADRLRQIMGCRIGVGFAKEYLGAHGSARMKYGAAAAKWDVSGNATFDETTNMFRYEERNGVCNYQ